jgi:hypothetical protein
MDLAGPRRVLTADITYTSSYLNIVRGSTYESRLGASPARRVGT